MRVSVGTCLALAVLISGVVFALASGDEISPSTSVHELGDEKSDADASTAKASTDEPEVQPATKHSSGGNSDDSADMSSLAAKAHGKAEFALNKIKTAKELRSKARQVLKSKGKPIPEILQKGALDDVNQRVLDAQEKLSQKFGASPKNDGEAEAKVEAKREKDPVVAQKLTTEVDSTNAAEQATKIQLKAADKKAQMYKDKFKDEERKEKSVAGTSQMEKAGMEQKAKLDQQMQQTQNDGKVQELEVKMREKAKEKMTSTPAESETDFNHRQIAQEAYNKQVMGYVMSWEKTHGGPSAGAQQAQEQALMKSDLEKFVNGYEDTHQKIRSDISAADTTP